MITYVVILGHGQIYYSLLWPDYFPGAKLQSVFACQFSLCTIGVMETVKFFAKGGVLKN